MRTRCLRGIIQTRMPLVTLAFVATLPFACSSQQPQQPGRTNESSLSPPPLGVAASFRVLGGSTVTNTGPTTIFGDLGVSPGSAITGFPPGLVLGGGAQHAADATALQAQSDVTSAYVVLAGDPCAHDLTGQDLGGLTLTPGVYCFSSEAQLTGTLVLDAQGDPSAVFVFQVGSKLTTASGASVAFVNGGQDCRVFWQIGSSATLGTDTVFAGSLLALTSIALETGASVSGRALARNGAVTMDTNHVFGTTCVSSGDAGPDGTAVESGGSDGAMVDVTATESGGGDAAESGSGSGGDSGSSSGGSSGGEAGVDGSAHDAASDATSDAGGSACCGAAVCGTSCTNLNGDTSNCGSCGNVCAAGQLCASGVCTACPSVCAGACTDLGSDAANCGTCGHACGASASCDNGACVPCAMACSGACVDLSSDNANCGSCGTACAPGASCGNGVCTACSMLCAGACVDLGNDPVNCGSCGTTCAWGQFCVSGVCMCQ
jgi:hypothetical protein